LEKENKIEKEIKVNDGENQKIEKRFFFALGIYLKKQRRRRNLER
jgi:hypothetical protein